MALIIIIRMHTASRGQGTQPPDYHLQSLETFLGTAISHAVEEGKRKKGFPSGEPPKQGGWLGLLAAGKVSAGTEKFSKVQVTESYSSVISVIPLSHADYFSL